MGTGGPEISSDLGAMKHACAFPSLVPRHSPAFVALCLARKAGEWSLGIRLCFPL